MSETPSEPPDSALQRLRNGDPSAVQAIWLAYFDQLARMAHQRLSPGLRRTVDGEDVALSVINTICRRAAVGELPDLNDRDDLWRLMMTILFHKTADRGREHRAQKRGGGRVRGDSIYVGAGSDAELQAFASVAEARPTPEQLLLLEEERQRLFALLDDDELRQIAEHRLAGASAEEIATILDVSPRTVRRKLEMIRVAWSHLLDE